MRIALALLITLLLFATTSEAQDNWPRFRGHNGNGLAEPIDVPSSWTGDDYVWSIDLPGTGHSSPVVWGKFACITSDAGNEMMVSSYDLATGEHLWSQPFDCQRGRMHAHNSPASTTPAVDAKNIYISWANKDGVYVSALTHAGKHAWSAKLPPFVGKHGFSSSPAVIGDLVCVNVDTSAGGFLVAYNCKDGREAWRVARADSDKETYATPCVITVDGRELIVAESKGGGLQAIDPADGKVAATTGGVFPSRTVSSPLVAGDMVFATCGSGNNGHLLVGAKFTGEGADVTFSLDRNVPYVPTGLVKDDLLFLWHDQGIVTCIDRDSKSVVWRKRVGGSYYGSPICVGDRLLNLSRQGKAVVVSASRDYKLLGETDLGEPTEASPSVAQGRLLLRTESKLHCLAAQQ